MGDTAILAWAGAVLVIGVNGFAAGIAAMIYIWRRQIRTGGRTAIAALAAGFLPAVTIAVIGLWEEGLSGDGPFTVALVFAVFLAIGSVVSLPGAILVARGLERPGDEFKAFQ